MKKNEYEWAYGFKLNDQPSYRFRWVKSDGNYLDLEGDGVLYEQAVGKAYDFMFEILYTGEFQKNQPHG